MSQSVEESWATIFRKKPRLAEHYNTDQKLTPRDALKIIRGSVGPEERNDTELISALENIIKSDGNVAAEYAIHNSPKRFLPAEPYVLDRGIGRAWYYARHFNKNDDTGHSGQYVRWPEYEEVLLRDGDEAEIYEYCRLLCSMPYKQSQRNKIDTPQRWFEGEAFLVQQSSDLDNPFCWPALLAVSIFKHKQFQKIQLAADLLAKMIETNPLLRYRLTKTHTKTRNIDDLELESLHSSISSLVGDLSNRYRLMTEDDDEDRPRRKLKPGQIAIDRDAEYAKDPSVDNYRYYLSQRSHEQVYRILAEEYAKDKPNLALIKAAEKVIMRNGYLAMKYALEIKQARFIEAEPKIISDCLDSQLYYHKFFVVPNSKAERWPLYEQMLESGAVNDREKKIYDYLLSVYGYYIKRAYNYGGVDLYAYDDYGHREGARTVRVDIPNEVRWFKGESILFDQFLQKNDGIVPDTGGNFGSFYDIIARRVCNNNDALESVEIFASTNPYTKIKLQQTEKELSLLSKPLRDIEGLELESLEKEINLLIDSITNRQATKSVARVVDDSYHSKLAGIDRILNESLTPRDAYGQLSNEYSKEPSDRNQVRINALEYFIKDDPEVVFTYATRLKKERFLAGEPALLKSFNATNSLVYAYHRHFFYNEEENRAYRWPELEARLVREKNLYGITHYIESLITLSGSPVTRPRNTGSTTRSLGYEADRWFEGEKILFDTKRGPLWQQTHLVRIADLLYAKSTHPQSDPKHPSASSNFLRLINTNPLITKDENFYHPRELYEETHKPKDEQDQKKIRDLTAKIANSPESILTYVYGFSNKRFIEGEPTLVKQLDVLDAFNYHKNFFRHTYWGTHGDRVDYYERWPEFEERLRSESLDDLTKASSNPNIKNVPKAIEKELLDYLRGIAKIGRLSESQRWYHGEALLYALSEMNGKPKTTFLHEYSPLETLAKDLGMSLSNLYTTNPILKSAAGAQTPDTAGIRDDRGLEEDFGHKSSITEARSIDDNDEHDDASIDSNIDDEFGDETIASSGYDFEELRDWQGSDDYFINRAEKAIGTPNLPAYLEDAINFQASKEVRSARLERLLLDNDKTGEQIGTYLQSVVIDQINISTEADDSITLTDDDGRSVKAQDLESYIELFNKNTGRWLEGEARLYELAKKDELPMAGAYWDEYVALFYDAFCYVLALSHDAYFHSVGPKDVEDKILVGTNPFIKSIARRSTDVLKPIRDESVLDESLGKLIDLIEKNGRKNV